MPCLFFAHVWVRSFEVDVFALACLQISALLTVDMIYSKMGWKSRRLVIDYATKDKSCTLEEPKKKNAKAKAVVDVQVRYCLVSEIIFQLVDKDDERIFLRRLRAVPQISQSLDFVFPFVDDEIVLPRAAARMLHVRIAKILSAIEMESDDVHSIATTLKGLADEHQSRLNTSPSHMAQDSETGWRLLDECSKGESVSMHDFTLCKCLMLSVVKKPTRHGGVQWPRLFTSVELDITVPEPIVAELSRRNAKADEGKVLKPIIAKTRLDRNSIHILTFNLRDFFGDLATSAHDDVSMLAEPVQLAFCEVMSIRVP